MKNLFLTQLCTDICEDCAAVMREYDDTEYLKHFLDKEELEHVCDVFESAASARNLNELYASLGEIAEYIIEDLDVPESDLSSWREELPIYMRQLIAYVFVVDELVSKWSRTCQRCGTLFFTQDKKEWFCQECRDEMEDCFLDLYLAYRDTSN